MSVERWEHVELARVRAAGAPPPQPPNTLNEAASEAAEHLRQASIRPGVVTAGFMALDAACFGLALWFAAFGATPSAGFDAGRAALLAGGGAMVLVGALHASKAYRLQALRRPGESLLRLAVSAALVLAFAVAGGVWGSDSAAIAWLAAGLLGAAGVALRCVAAPVAQWFLDAGVTERRAVVVGGGGNAEKLIRGLAANPDNDIRIVGVFDDRGDDRSPPIVAGRRKLGTVAELVAFARIARIDMLIVTLPLSAEERILNLLRQLWVLPVDVRLSAYSADYSFPRAQTSSAAGPFISVLRQPIAGARQAAKRVLDLVVASLALTALSPVMLLTALAIRLETPGPVFFRQNRHGFNHQPVRVWKFRSLRHECADPMGRTIVTRADPRVTRVGRFIRRASIDELPQLFNVLAGELSLVGPRPHAVDARSSRHEMFAEIVEGYSGRHKVAPGITGWAQVNGWRGEVDDPEKLKQRFEHDLYYIENWSLLLDLRILAMTPLSLLSSRGAY
ncbi:MAG: exopolysaccharide biosynthesis polyprenyl glycosylphosphotransferase [Rhodobacteraceae bacterium]|nr:MAG: exopolysaccharide biosynthesis polyprenyl glycosylphosphotransferase [Paracoccaceae bacterium]